LREGRRGRKRTAMIWDSSSNANKSSKSGSRSKSRSRAAAAVILGRGGERGEKGRGDSSTLDICERFPARIERKGGGRDRERGRE